MYPADGDGAAMFGLFAQAENSTRLGAPGRGAVTRVQSDGQSCILKHYCRGGFAVNFSLDAYLWTGLLRNRAFKEWQLLASMHAQGLPVPQPVAARVIRDGLFYRADLVTTELTETRTLAQVLESESLAWGAWWRLGAVIRRFHEALIDHADLNADNILLDTEGRVSLIDFDKGRRRGRAGRWQDGNLERLRRSLLKQQRLGRIRHFSEQDFDALKSAYSLCVRLESSSP